MLPATVGEVRQPRHLWMGKPEGENTALGKSCGLIYSKVLWEPVCMSGSLTLDTVLKMSLKIHLFPEMMTGSTISGAS